MFTELLISACLLGAGLESDCRDFSQLYDVREVSLLTCSMSGMVEVARWSSRNPAWTVTRWRCGVVDTRVSEI
jgi:hypothetical protein